MASREAREKAIEDAVIRRDVPVPALTEADVCRILGEEFPRMLRDELQVIDDERVLYGYEDS